MPSRSLARKHVLWNFEILHRVMNGEDVDAERIGRDDLCEVGAWIYGEGAQHRHLPAYDDFQKIHAQYHACVAEAVRRAADGDRKSALKQLDQKGQCLTLSRQLIEIAAHLSDQTAD